MLSQKDRQKIVQQSESWLDDNFGQLDWSGFPALAPEQPKRAEKEFAQSYGDGSGLTRSANDLRAFVSNPDLETLQRVAEETGSGDLIAEVRDIRGTEVVREFKRRNPAYIPTDQNFRTMISLLATNLLDDPDIDSDEAVDLLIAGGQWTVKNLQAAFQALRREGLLNVPQGEARELTAAERLRVARLAQNGHADEAIDTYLKYALGEEIGVEILSDPAYRGATDDAVWYVWQLVTPDFSHTPERQQFFSHFVGQRPFTLHLLNAAWSACQRHESKLDRDRSLGLIEQQTAEPERTLDDLDDASVESLLLRTRREHARQRRGPGVLV